MEKISFENNALENNDEGMNMSDEIDVEDAEDQGKHFGDDFRDYIDNHGHWLDYKIEHEFTSTAPPARLIRFMPLEQYLSILTTRQLFFPRATQFDDPYDCAVSGSLSDAICKKLVESCDEPEFSLPGDADHFGFVVQAEEALASELSDRFADEVPDRWFVSCWHADSDNLKDLMWRSYGGHKGVCISVDGQSLLTEIQNSVWAKANWLNSNRGIENFDFMHGYVDYERPVFEVESDDESGPVVTVRHPAFHKNHFFSMDQEYRFAVRLKSKHAGYFSAGAKFDLTACDAKVSTSPLCPAWIANSIEALTKQYYLNLKVDHLSLEIE